MRSSREVAYRLKVAEGFTAECREDVTLQRWRSAVDNAQLAIEHAAKAVLALLGPVGRTHNPALQLHQALQDEKFASSFTLHVRRLAELAQLLGSDIHVQTDYGNEAEFRTPWELFDETDAGQALAAANEAVSLARQIDQQWQTLAPGEEGSE